jgi:hypothetical protein
VRDSWLREDLPSWLACHRFYGSLIPTLNEIMAASPAVADRVFIITTKEQRFASALCDAGQLRIPPERVFGLEAGKKNVVLDQLAARFPKASKIVFIEDRLKTLEKVDKLTLPDTRRRLELYLADWGFNTDVERERARRLPFVNLTNIKQFESTIQSDQTAV